MKRNKLLAHIDYGSKDNSGLYIKQTIDSIDFSEECDNVVFVNYHYKYDIKGLSRTFEKYSNFFSKNRLVTKAYKFIDLYISFYKIFLALNKENYKRDITCVISLNAPWVHYKFLIYLLKKLDCKIYFILHDIVELHVNAPSFLTMSREKIIKKADGLIVHTQESKKYAKEHNENIYYYSFPLMNINEKNKSKNKNELPTFLFIGSIRPEKGVDILIEAINRSNINLKCVVAGKTADGMSIRSSSNDKIEIIDKYLSDKEYEKLITSCHYVVLPYTKGTNSGILSTVVSCDKPVLCSDICMFVESGFVISDNIFQQNSVSSLLNMIENVCSDFPNRYMHDLALTKNKVRDYQRDFRKEVNEVYKKI